MMSKITTNLEETMSLLTNEVKSSLLGLISLKLKVRGTGCFYVRCSYAEVYDGKYVSAQFHVCHDFVWDILVT